MRPIRTLGTSRPGDCHRSSRLAAIPKITESFYTHLDRQLEILSAFIARHPGCIVQLVADWSEPWHDRFLEVYYQDVDFDASELGESPPGWKDFQIEDDRLLYQLAVHLWAERDWVRSKQGLLMWKAVQAGELPWPDRNLDARKEVERATRTFREAEANLNERVPDADLNRRVDLVLAIKSGVPVTGAQADSNHMRNA